jgi:hypothetical protein
MEARKNPRHPQQGGGAGQHEIDKVQHGAVTADALALQTNDAGGDEMEREKDGGGGNNADGGGKHETSRDGRQSRDPE